MKKKSVLYIFVALFGLFFNSFVLADDDNLKKIDIDFNTNESRKEIPVSVCENLDEAADDYLEVKKGVKSYLIVKKVPEIGYVSAKIKCHSAMPWVKDEYEISVKISNTALIDNAASTYKEISYYFYSSAYKNEATVQSMITNSNIKVPDSSITTSSDYSSCRRLENYQYADIKQVSDAVAFYVVKSPGKTATNYINTFDCIKKNALHSRERVIVYVGMGAKEYDGNLNDDSNNSGDNNQNSGGTTTSDPIIINLSKKEGNKKLSEYSYCKFKDSSNENNSLITNEVNDGYAYVRVTDKEPNQETAIMLDCTRHDSKENQDVKILLQANNKGNSSGSSSSNADDDDSNNYDWGDPDGDCNFIFGDFSKPGTFGNMLRQILKFIQFLGPVLVVVLSIMDLVKVVTSGDKDALSKFLNKTVKRLIYAVLLFVFPTILDYILRWTNVYGTCTILK